MQIFHTLYHTDENILLGAPTGSGKTISAELAILRNFAAHPARKIIYIAPLKVSFRCQEVGVRQSQVCCTALYSVPRLLMRRMFLSPPAARWQSAGHEHCADRADRAGGS